MPATLTQVVDIVAVADKTVVFMPLTEAGKRWTDRVTTFPRWGGGIVLQNLASLDWAKEKAEADGLTVEVM